MCRNRLGRAALSLDKENCLQKFFEDCEKERKQPLLARDHGAHAQNYLSAQCQRKLSYWSEADLNRMWIGSYPTLYLSDSLLLTVNLALNSIPQEQLNFRRRPILCTTLYKRATSVAHLINFSFFIFLYNFHTRCPLLFLYQWWKKSQKLPKTKIKGILP